MSLTRSPMPNGEPYYGDDPSLDSIVDEDLLYEMREEVDLLCETVVNAADAAEDKALGRFVAHEKAVDASFPGSPLDREVCEREYREASAVWESARQKLDDALRDLSKRVMELDDARTSMTNEETLWFARGWVRGGAFWSERQNKRLAEIAPQER